MAKAATIPPSVLKMLKDPSVPLENRVPLFLSLAQDGRPECLAVVAELLKLASVAGADETAAEKVKQLDEVLTQMEQGPLRTGRFLNLTEGRGGVRRARVLMDDGGTAFVVVPDPTLAGELRRGDEVLLEAQAKALLARDPTPAGTGEEARLERVLDGGRLEVSLRDHERFVYWAAAGLQDRIAAGEVAAGRTLVVCTRRQMAFDALPPIEGLAHYSYLVREAPPNVVIERDIGAPPRFLTELSRHIRREMTAPELGRRYGLRRCDMRLLAGVSGSGKTLCIQGFWRRMYDIMAEVTGVPHAGLPHRVMRLRAPEILSKWLGESDKKLDRFFNEIDQLADELFTTPTGEEYELPLLVIMEECDGLARTRGEDAIYDRIQTTLLQRLDTTSQKLSDKLVIFCFSTNVPQVVDPAFLRRAGGTTERFGRLGRRQFEAVLTKHLRGLPFPADPTAPANPADAGDPAATADGAARAVVRELTSWLYSPNGPDRGQVELSLAGSAQPLVRYRRDFLTGALVDRAVQEAAREACEAERAASAPGGLTAALLARAIERQVRSIADQLHPHNVTNYLDLPDGVRVVNLRRIDQPAVLPFDLLRAS